MSYEDNKCPVCGNILATNWYKRHLVEVHDWGYTKESPNMPTPKENRP